MFGGKRILSKITLSNFETSKDFVKPLNSVENFSVDFPKETAHFAGVQDIGKFGSVTKFTLSNDCSISFPRSGKQPTTEDVFFLSQAKVDIGKLDSPVTDFFVHLYGGPSIFKKDSQSVRLGFSNDFPSSPVSIINILHSKEYVTFWNLFREVASTSEGRALLYRLLIEIRRQNSEGMSVCEHSTMGGGNRRYNRTIDVFAGERFFFLSRLFVSRERP